MDKLAIYQILKEIQKHEQRKDKGKLLCFKEELKRRLKKSKSIKMVRGRDFKISRRSKKVGKNNKKSFGMAVTPA